MKAFSLLDVPLPFEAFTVKGHRVVFLEHRSTPNFDLRGILFYPKTDGRMRGYEYGWTKYGAIDLTGNCSDLNIDLTSIPAALPYFLFDLEAAYGN